MVKDEMYVKLRTDLENHIHFSEDKPEETVDSSLKALWLLASGIRKSAEEALNLPLPDLSEHQFNKLYQFIDQRLKGKPLAYITGRQSFMGIELFCDQRALIPRKETEILGKKAIELGQQIAKSKQDIRIFDVCCGSGNLGIALANSLPTATIFSSDLSSDAISLMQENVCLFNHANHIRLFQSDLFSAFEIEDFDETIDLIVCNPPYISSSKVGKLNAEISENEPLMAFDGGMLGTKVLQKLIREAPRYLTGKGWVIFEVGVGQGSFMIQLIEKTGLYDQISSALDEMGNIRVVYMRKKPTSIEVNFETNYFI
jgi:release factor glutamine methyltransferase